MTHLTLEYIKHITGREPLLQSAVAGPVQQPDHPHGEPRGARAAREPGPLLQQDPEGPEPRGHAEPREAEAEGEPDIALAGSGGSEARPQAQAPAPQEHRQLRLLPRLPAGGLPADGQRALPRPRGARQQARALARPGERSAEARRAQGFGAARAGSMVHPGGPRVERAAGPRPYRGADAAAHGRLRGRPGRLPLGPEGGGGASQTAGIGAGRGVSWAGSSVLEEV
mmetsp:Transcript_18048/g.56817  ORF Transcript_18048/g.56817 Transcript_18048/m.56817 type:complete len:226 (-) Transcript_18048:43-720(-)